MDNLEERFYKQITLALILGIIFTAAFNTYMRREFTSNSGFTELYFEDHQTLPKIMKVNHTYNITFTFTNHENDDQEYVLEIETPEKKIRQNIFLGKTQGMTIMLEVTPENQGWLITKTTNITKKQTKKISGGSLETITLNIKGLGEILNHNTTIQELRERPIKYETTQEYEARHYDTTKPLEKTITIQDLGFKDEEIKEKTTTIGHTQYSLKNKTQEKNPEETGIEKQTIKTTNKINAKDEKITITTKTTIEEKTITQKPITIKLSKKTGGEQLEIYWWVKII
ncbi:MAG TPA: hypothetical protein ENN13_04965 [Candidatus Altiarchaeales archaeon]|nr:hypothetical protein [Candidatus Altiarchaeales archaeon]